MNAALHIQQYRGINRFPLSKRNANARIDNAIGFKQRITFEHTLARITLLDTTVYEKIRKEAIRTKEDARKIVFRKYLKIRSL